MRGILFALAFVTATLTSFSTVIEVPTDYLTIQDAIDNSVNGDTVSVLSGTYMENIKFNGKAITIRSQAGSATTVIDGAQNGSVVVFDQNEGSGSVLDGFTITNGSGTMFNNILCGGGVADVSNSSYPTSPSIVNCIITGNSSYLGGGIFLQGGLIYNNLVTGNTAQRTGGGVFNGWGYQSSLIISDNCILNNSVTCDPVLNCGEGGGIACNSCPITLIHNNEISGNSILSSGTCYCRGGGIYISGNAHDRYYVIHNTIHENKIMAGLGGGLFIDINHYGTYSRDHIHGNIISFNTIVNDGLGGGFYARDTDFTNNLIVNNKSGSSSKGGGGILIPGNIDILFYNNTVANNSATSGGGLFIYGDYLDETVNIRDSIIHSNTATYSYQIALEKWQTKLSIHHSDIEGGSSGITSFNPNNPWHTWGAGCIDADPIFTSGASGNYLLQQDPCQSGIVNPCVDGGSDNATNLGLDTLWTRTDEVADSGVADMGYHYGELPKNHWSLLIESEEISAATGGTSHFLLNAGPNQGTHSYLIFGSISGTSPGLTFPNTTITLPINWDLFTNVVLSYVNQPMFTDFMGSLDSFGRYEALLDLPPLPVGAAGITLSFAYGCMNGSGKWCFASNAVALGIVP